MTSAPAAGMQGQRACDRCPPDVSWRSRRYRAVTTAIARDAEQGPDLIERKAKVARTSDKRQAAQFRVTIIAIIRAGARWLGQQPYPFIIADGFDFRPRCLAQVSNRECHTLYPVVTTGPV